MSFGKLKIGAFGSEVHTLHNLLQQHGFEIPSNEVKRNFFGPKTRDALCQFQRRQNLKVSGYLDLATKTLLVEVIPSKNRSIANVVHDLKMQCNQIARELDNSSCDFSSRDNPGKMAFYVPLWKRKNLESQDFYDYWRDVHGPLCAQIPGQFQYWQFHLTQNIQVKFPSVEGVLQATDNDLIDGIAELTFRSDMDRQLWLQNSQILMDDEHNLFRKAIGYITNEGNSHTYIDRIEKGDPNGNLGVVKFHVMVQKQSDIGVEEFRHYMQESFAKIIIKNPFILKFRLHLFEPLDLSRPEAQGVTHSAPPEQQFQAAYEIAFLNDSNMEKFFASSEYRKAVANQGRYVKQIIPFREDGAYTFVYNGQKTLAGERGSRTAALMVKIGAANPSKNHETINLTRPTKSNPLFNRAAQTANRNPKKTIAKIFSLSNQNEAPIFLSESTINTFPTQLTSLNKNHDKSQGRINFYEGMVADYSIPQQVSKSVANKLIFNAEKFIKLKEHGLPDISATYTLEDIEKENREWWPSHCEALRQGRGDLLTLEYHENLVYFCQDGPYYGLDQQKEREQHWWALISQPGAIMTWPIVMFHGEFVWFEWASMDLITHETIAKGCVAWIRRGHRGGCYFKGEQLTFYRDVFASPELLGRITTSTPVQSLQGG